MINVDQLLKLDRLRDKMLVETGNKKILEICENPNKVLKSTENYSYRKVEVLDGALYDENNRGIVDEIVRMTFEDETCPQSLVKFDRYNGITKETHGFYLRYKKTDDSHPFNTLFRACEKAYFEKFRGKNEKYSEEDHRSQARLITFEILAGANESFNNGFRNKFNLDITNLDDFKYMLLDLELCKIVKKYIIKSVAIQGYISPKTGRSSDYILQRKKVNGNEIQSTVQLSSISLDKPCSDGGDDGYNLATSGVYDDNNESLDTLAGILDNELDEDNKSIYTYILKNINTILTKNQIEFFNVCLESKEHEVYNVSQRSKFKKAIRDNIDKFLYNNKHIDTTKEKHTIRNIDLVDSITDILNSLDNKERFNKLVSYLKKDDKISNLLIDIIYDIDFKHRRLLTLSLLERTTDADKDTYVDKEFIHVLNALNKHLTFVLKNNEEIYMFNKTNKVDEIELLVKKFIEDNLFKYDKDEGALPRHSIDDYLGVDELYEFLVTTFPDRKLGQKNRIRKVLNEFGYDLSKKPTRTIRNVPTYRVYRI